MATYGNGQIALAELVKVGQFGVDSGNGDLAHEVLFNQVAVHAALPIHRIQGKVLWAKVALKGISLAQGFAHSPEFLVREESSAFIAALAARLHQLQRGAQIGVRVLGKHLSAEGLFRQRRQRLINLAHPFILAELCRESNPDERKFDSLYAR